MEWNNFKKSVENLSTEMSATLINFFVRTAQISCTFLLLFDKENKKKKQQTLFNRKSSTTTKKKENEKLK